jgi:hypothetical protein
MMKRIIALTLCAICLIAIMIVLYVWVLSPLQQPVAKIGPAGPTPGFIASIGDAGEYPEVNAKAFNVVLGSDGAIRDFDHHLITDEFLKNYFQEGVSKDHQSLCILGLFLSNDKETSVETLALTLKRLRSLADPRKRTIIIITIASSFSEK